MICTICNNPGILNTANGKDFYYCRTCKDEIKAIPDPAHTTPSSQSLEELDLDQDLSFVKWTKDDEDEDDPFDPDNITSWFY